MAAVIPHVAGLDAPRGNKHAETTKLPHKNAYFTCLHTERFTSSTHSAPAFPASLLLTPTLPRPPPPPLLEMHAQRAARTHTHTQPQPAIYTQARTFKNIHSFSFSTHPRAHKQRMLEVNPRPRCRPQRSEGKAQATAGILHHCAAAASQPPANLQLNPNLSPLVTLEKTSHWLFIIYL